MSVGRYLLILVFSILFPAMIACGLAVQFTYSQERDNAERNLLRTSQVLAESVDHELDAIVRRLEALALSPSLRQGDLADFWQQARRVARDDGMWIVLRDLDGQQLVNTLKPFGTVLPRMGPDHPTSAYVRRAFATRAPVVSDLVTGPLVGQPVLGVVVPVLGPEGRPLYNLTMAVRPSALAGLVNSVSLPDNWLAGVFDTQLATIARSHLAEDYIGKPPAPALAEAMQHSEAGLVDAISHEGIETRVAFSRSPAFGWWFAVGVPKSELAATARGAIAAIAGAAIALLVAGLGCAAFFGRRLSGALGTLVERARRLGRGELGHHRQTGIDEVDTVSAAFVQAGKALLDSRTALTAAKDEAERANVAKSQFFAAASHDLRQPVQSLFFFHEILAQRLADHPALPVVGKMQAGLDSLKALLDGLLDISRLQAGAVEIEPTTFPLALLFEHLEESFPRAEALGLSLRFAASSHWVRSDQAQLGRILRNLVDNAMKYTPPGGAILVGCRRAGNCVRIQVSDTGPGIPADKLETVFEEFVQLNNPDRDRAKGLGLGLSIVRHLARLLDHPVAVQSRPGHGTTFTVTVPLAEPRD